MLKHLLVDVLDKDMSIELAIRSRLSEKCKLVFESNELKLGLFACNDGVVYLSRVSTVLLLDILGPESILDSILDILPKNYLMIRLLERGIPVE